MKNEPIVASIILPAFNEEAHLAKTIHSIRRSITYSGLNCEVIVVDNNSTDGTLEAAMHLADAVYTEKKHVIAAVRNTGARHARGKYLIFIDADTVLPLNLIRDFIHVLRTKAVVVGCKVMPRPLKNHERIMFNFFNFILRSSVVHGPAFSGNAVGYRTDVFNKLGGFDEARVASEDHDLSNRAAKLGKPVFLHNMTVITSNRRVRNLGLVRLVLGWSKTTVFYLLGIKRKKYTITR